MHDAPQHPLPMGRLPVLTTRLAPSPTGALHLGNVRTFLLTWALARRHGWRIILRIEDLDTPRVKPGTIDATIRTLEWLGMDWDAGPIIQSHDLPHHRAAMERLAARGLVYPSAESRTEVEEAAATLAASAPQAGSRESAFPAALRPPDAGTPRPFAGGEGQNWRFMTPPGPVPVDDLFAGPQSFDVANLVGDFVVWTRRACPSYQLAVVLDDARQGVTHIVRGDDLLDSAARQRLLISALSLSPEPQYLHVPLVLGPDGRRLAKRHGDTRVEAYRARGVTPERLIALMGRWCGLPDAGDALPAGEFRDRLDLRTLPRDSVVFTAEDDAWLVSSGGRKRGG